MDSRLNSSSNRIGLKSKCVEHVIGYQTVKVWFTSDLYFRSYDFLKSTECCNSLTSIISSRINFEILCLSAAFMLCRFSSVQSEHLYWAAECIMQMSQQYKSLKWAEFGQKWNQDFRRSYPIVYSFTYLFFNERMSYSTTSLCKWVFLHFIRFTSRERNLNGISMRKHSIINSIFM